MRNVLELEPAIHISRGNSYIVSYPYILAHFRNMDILSEKDFVYGAHIVYGWMPTILHLNPGKIKVSLSSGAEIVSLAKNTWRIADSELELLANLVNNLLVADSKLLHFVSPEDICNLGLRIYDSKCLTC